MNRFFLSAALVVLASACGGPAPIKDAEACEHLNEGPNEAVTATATASGAPSINTEHTRFDVTFVDVTGGKGGSVSYAAAHEAHHVIFLNEDVPVKVTSSAGADVAITSSEPSDCSAVKARHEVPLAVGTYTLTFGPTDKASVRLVIEAEKHGH